MHFNYCFLDLDGTLTDSEAGITNSVMYALKQYDIHVEDKRELYPFIGPPLSDSFKKYFGFTESQATRAIGYYREYYRRYGIFENRVYPGIPEMLSALRKKRVTIALATSKPFEFSVKILKHFGLYPFFDHIGAATMDGRISRKSDVIAHLLEDLDIDDRTSVLMVGDRDQDIEGAKANSLSSAGVLWGYGSPGELQDAGADFVIPRPEDLLTTCF